MNDVRKFLLERIEAPASEPLTLEETKLYLRVDSDVEDSLIEDLIVAARMAAEQFLRQSLMMQSWKLAYDDYLPEFVRLPMGPVTGVESVTVISRTGDEQVITDNYYYLNAARDMLILDSVLFGHRVEVMYDTGYGDAADVPSPIRGGLLAHIAAMYDLRGEHAPHPLPDQAVRLYMPFREIRL